MPELDLGSVIGPQGPKGDKGIDGAVGPMGPQGEKGDDGAAASINGVNALTMTTGDGLEATMNGSAYQMKLADNALNAVQAVPTFVRPNLLDNWYFGNPVDQRGGKIVRQGIMAYRDAGCTIEAGGVSEPAMPVYKVSAQVYAFTGGDNNTYYVKAADVVRGYTGTWTSAIDRWLLGSLTVMEITDGGIHVSYTQTGWNVIQKLKNVLYKGNTYTFSAIYKSTNPLRLVVNWGDNKYFFNESSPATSEWALVTITGTVPNDAEITYEQVVFQSLGAVAGTMDIKAAKLELGPTQTLAHQENGQWVLNEVPEYGEQLRRCQRYRSERKKATGYVSYSSGGVVIISPMAGCSFPVTMRTNPSCAIFAADVAKTANKVSYYSNFENLADGTVSSVSADDNDIYIIRLQDSSIPVGTIVEFCYVANADL